MSNINFDNPWLLLVAIPVLLLLLIPFFLTVRKDNRNANNVISCILHVLIAACIAFTVAGPTIKTFNQEINVYVVADLSYSTNRKLDQIDEHIRYLDEHLPSNGQMGVICFGGTDAHDINTRMGETFVSVRNSLSEEKLSNADISSTDIPSALRKARSLFKAGVVERIVLITDAKNSDLSDENILKSTVVDLTAEGIYIDAIYVDSNISETEKEVQISGVECLEEVYLGQESTVRVQIQSSTSTQRTLQLDRFYQTEEGKVEENVLKRMVELNAGPNSVTLPLKTDVEGTFTYHVSFIEQENDENLLNNSYDFTQVVADKPSMLFVTDSLTSEEDIATLSGNAYSQVDVRNIAMGDRLPLTIKELCAYDQIILSDVNISTAKDYNLFVDSLHTVVTQLGKSLIGLGDLGLEGATDQSLVKLAGLLPVRYGNPKKEGTQYAIVLDVSQSMQFYDRWELAKSAAKQLVDIVMENPNNKLSFITFCDGADTIKSVHDRMTTDELKNKIDEMELRHGTNIASGLNMADLDLKDDYNEMNTQVFLLTDGETAAAEKSASVSTSPNYADSLLGCIEKKFAENDVPVTLFGIRARDNEEVLKSILQKSTESYGTYYSISDTSSLRETFETFAEEESEEYNKRLGKSSKNRLNEEALQGISDEVLNNGFVKGFLLAQAKPSATVVLNVERAISGSKLQIPLYSYWKCGNGKAAAFLSNFSDDEVDGEVRNGTTLWRTLMLENGNSLYQQFFENVLASNIPSQRVSVPFQVDITKKEGNVTLAVRPALLQPGAQVDIFLYKPNSAEPIAYEKIVLAANAYTCTFTTLDVGEYRVEIHYTYQGETASATRYIYQPYLAEYDRFVVFDASPLYKMLSGNGIVSEDGKIEIVNDEEKVGTKIVDLTPIFLIVAIALLLIDIVVRKVKWADIKNLFRRRKKGGRA